MSFQQRAKEELKAVALTTLYFATWLGVLLILKGLVLAEYQIEFRGFSMALIGALILAKVVLVMEHVPLGSWLRRRPAVFDVIVRTALYGLGVFLSCFFSKRRSKHGTSTAASAPPWPKCSSTGTCPTFGPTSFA